MNRTGAFIALAIAAVAGTVFALFPQLDIAVTRLFYEASGGFELSSDRTFMLLRDGSMLLVGLLVAPAAAALAAKLVQPSHRLLIPGRATVFLLVTVLLGPLLISNVVLKDHWGRPRPRDTVAFGGKATFVPWWDPRGTCPDNCSFVAGEASGAFWTLAPAALAPPQWRAVAYGAALAFGTAVGFLRIGFGGHFLTDVVFAGVFMFLIIWLVHGLLYRWCGTYITDERIERLIGWIGLAIRKPFAGLFARADARREVAEEKRP
jgi:lipid A 4'-phosphatase